MLNEFEKQADLGADREVEVIAEVNKVTEIVTGIEERAAKRRKSEVVRYALWAKKPAELITSQIRANQIAQIASRDPEAVRVITGTYDKLEAIFVQQS